MVNRSSVSRWQFSVGRLLAALTLFGLAGGCASLARHLVTTARGTDGVVALLVFAVLPLIVAGILCLLGGRRWALIGGGLLMATILGLAVLANAIVPHLK